MYDDQFLQSTAADSNFFFSFSLVIVPVIFNMCIDENPLHFIRNFLVIQLRSGVRELVSGREIVHNVQVGYSN